MDDCCTAGAVCRSHLPSLWRVKERGVIMSYISGVGFLFRSWSCADSGIQSAWLPGSSTATFAFCRFLWSYTENSHFFYLQTKQPPRKQALAVSVSHPTPASSGHDGHGNRSLEVCAKQHCAAFNKVATVSCAGDSKVFRRDA